MSRRNVSPASRSITSKRPPPCTGPPGATWTPCPHFRFVTGSLHVNYLKPTPLGVTLEIRGKVKEIKGRKVVVETTVLANATATGEVVAVQMRDSFVS
jgi:acyl-coenzyme A thioesterase PaaI-like protein